MRSKFLPPAKEVVWRQCFQSCISVCLFTEGAHVTITLSTFDITIFTVNIQGHPPSNGPRPHPWSPYVQGPPNMFKLLQLWIHCTWAAPLPELFKMVQLGPHCTDSPRSPLPPPPEMFMMKHIQLASRRLAFYWYAFLWNKSGNTAKTKYIAFHYFPFTIIVLGLSRLFDDYMMTIIQTRIDINKRRNLDISVMPLALHHGRQNMFSQVMKHTVSAYLDKEPFKRLNGFYKILRQSKTHH